MTVKLRPWTPFRAPAGLLFFPFPCKVKKTRNRATSIDEGFLEEGNVRIVRWTMQVFGRQPLNLHEVHTPRGKVFLIPERCKECHLCVDFCPEGVLQLSSRRNRKGYHYPEIVPGKEEACVHCEYCSLVCPEYAIFTVEAEE